MKKMMGKIILTFMLGIFVFMLNQAAVMAMSCLFYTEIRFQGSDKSEDESNTKNAVPQGMAGNGNTIYLLKTRTGQNGAATKDYIIKILNANTNSPKVILPENSIGAGHGNGMTYYNGYLYVANGDGDDLIYRVQETNNTTTSWDALTEWTNGKGTAKYKAEKITVAGINSDENIKNIAHYTGNYFIVCLKGKYENNNYLLTYGIGIIEGNTFTIQKRFTVEKNDTYKAIQDIDYRDGYLWIILHKTEDTKNHILLAEIPSSYQEIVEGKTYDIKKTISIEKNEAGRSSTRNELESVYVNGSYIYAWSNISTGWYETLCRYSRFPNGVSITSVITNSKTSLEVKWNPVSNADKFRIDRRSENGEYSTIATVDGSVTSYKDTGLTAGTKYYYRVYGVNSDGSSPKKDGVLGVTRTDTPKVNSVTPISASELKVGWTAVTGAKKYIVCRKKEGSGEGWGFYSRIAETTATEYLDRELDSNTKYHYGIIAVTETGVESGNPNDNGNPGSENRGSGTTLGKYILDINSYFEGKDYGDLGSYGTVDIYINGLLDADDISDYYKEWPQGSRYEIKDIKTSAGYQYTGLHNGSLSGTMSTGNIDIRLAYVLAGQEMPSGYDRILPDGDYMIVSAADPAYYLDIVGGDESAPNGTNVQLYGPTSANLSAADTWTITYSGGFYSICQKDSGAALDVTDGSRAIRTNVRVSQNNNVNSQKWAISHFEGGKGYRIQAKCSGYSLDAAGGTITTGVNVQQYTGNTSITQRWLFIPYNPTRIIEDGRYVMITGVDPHVEMDVPGDTGSISEGENIRVWNDACPSRYNSFDVRYVGDGYYNLVHAASGKYLEVSGSSTDNDGNIQLSSSSGQNSQKWCIIPQNGGYMLVNRNSGLAMDVENGLAADGTNVRQQYYNGSIAETWSFKKAEYRVAYDANGGTGAPAAQTKYYANVLKLSTAQPAWNGHVFKGWAGSSTAAVAEYQTGASYTADSDVTFYAVWAIQIGNASVSGITNEVYTGAALTQSPTVVVDSMTLVNGTDYTLSYSNNVNAGTATVTITGKGKYTGSLSRTFTISAASLSGASVSGITNRTYTGSAQTQSPTVTLGGRSLTNGTDYTLSYADNINVGTATVYINGKGNYTGTLNRTFTISSPASQGPVIVTQPSSTTRQAGTTAVFSVRAQGSGLSYQWQYKEKGSSTWNKCGLTGAKTQDLQVPATTARDGYSYRCVVTDADMKTMTSNAAVLTVSGGLAITKHPQNVSTEAGKTVFFSVTVSGNGLSYQWQYKEKGGNTWNKCGLTGAKTDTVDVPATAVRDGYSYRCVVTDGSGNTAVSNSAVLTILKNEDAFAITSHPVSRTSTVGKTVTFSVKATGKGLTYQWQYRPAGTGIWYRCGLTGAKTDTVTVPVTESRNGTSYRCVVTDASGSSVESRAATLSVGGELAIIRHPSPVTAPAGSMASLSVTAAGTGLSYQWQYRIPGKTEWNKCGLEGAKTDTVRVPVTAERNGYSYRCIVTDYESATLESYSAVLTVSGTNGASGMLVTGEAEDISETVVIPKNDKEADDEYMEESISEESKADGTEEVQAVPDAVDNEEKTLTSVEVTGMEEAETVETKEGTEPVEVGKIINAELSDVADAEEEPSVSISIVSQPESIEVEEGEPAILKVEAEGEGLTYKWQFRPVDGKEWEDMDLFTLKELGLEVEETEENVFATRADAILEGLVFRCVIWNEDGQHALSDEVYISVFSQEVERNNEN